MAVKKGGPQKEGPGFGSNMIILITNVVHKIGIPGSLIVLLIFLILCKSSDAQKEEIIDKWILFKNNDNCQVFAISCIVFSFIIYIVELYVFRRIRKLDTDEIKRLQKKIK